MEEMKKTIITNINLLNNAGLKMGKVEFVEESTGIIKIKEFENIAYKLLTIIKPSVKEEITWPFLKTNKKDYNGFLKTFVNIIKMSNSNHSQVLPNITVSRLRDAKGKDFIRFFSKLTTLALEIQLKTMMSPAEQKKILAKPLPLNEDSGQKIKLDLMKSAVQKETEALLMVLEHNKSANELIENLQSTRTNLEKECKIAEENLASAVEDLDVCREEKISLCDLEDTSAISAYNIETEKKETYLNLACEKIVQIRDLAKETCKLADTEDFSLDGQDITKAVSRINHLAPTNSLLEVVKAFCGDVIKAHCGQYWDVESQGEKPLYTVAEENRLGTMGDEKASSKLLNTLQITIQESKPFVDTLRNNQHDRMVPGNDEADCHTLNIVVPSDARPKLPTTNPKNRRSINTVINRRKNGVAVLCSYKNKPCQQMFSTGLNYSQKSRKLLKKRYSLAMQVSGGSLKYETPKLPLATSTPAVFGPGSSGLWSRTTSGIHSIPELTLTAYPESPLSPLASGFAAPKPVNTSMGCKPKETTSASSAAEGKKAGTAKRRSVQKGTHRSSAVKKPAEESSEQRPNIPSRRPRKSLEDIIKRYHALKKKEND